MGNIPNTNTPNLVLQSVGNGSNDSRWGTSGGGSGTVPNGTATGQTIYWNNTTSAWTLATQPTTDAQVLIWNSSTNVWAPKTIASDVTITNAGVATVAKIQGNAVLGGVPTTGQVLTWNAGGYWAPATSTSGITQLTGDVTAGPGSGSQASTVAKIKGTALGTLTGAINGNALIWNTPSSSWIPADPTFGGYTVNMGSLAPTTDNGSIPYFSNVGAVNQFVPGPVPTTTGHYYSWNTGASGHWEVLLANPGGALSNQGWTSTSIIPSSGTLPITSAGKIVEVTGITGFSSYLIGFNITATNGDATTGRNLNAYIYQGSSAVAQQRQFMVNNQTGSTSVSYLATGLTSGTTYSFAGYAFQGGSSTGTVLFATITVLGIA